MKMVALTIVTKIIVHNYDDKNHQDCTWNDIYN
jgi:hypothetical protein